MYADELRHAVHLLPDAVRAGDLLTVMNLLTALQQWLALRGDSGPVVVAGAPSKGGKKS